MKIKKRLAAFCLTSALIGQGTLMEKPLLGCARVVGKSCEPVIHDLSEVVFSSVPLRLGLLDRKDFIIAKVGDENYLKRIEGIPGDTVVQTFNGIYLNGEKIYEYNFTNNSGLTEYPRFRETKLAEDEYFLIGPNIYNSHDSRYFGPLKRKDICGKVITTFQNQ